MEIYDISLNDSKTPAAKLYERKSFRKCVKECMNYYVPIQQN